MEVSMEMLYGSVFLYHYESTQANEVIHREKLISIRSDGVSPSTRVLVLLSQDLPSHLSYSGLQGFLYTVHDEREC